VQRDARLSTKLQFDRPSPAEENPTGAAILLIPGFRDRPRTLRYLARELRKRGAAPHSVSPQPSSGHIGLDAMAAQLARYIDETFTPGRPLVLFGFSMGGLICRYYIQRLGGAARTRRLVTLATPHQGTYMAYLYRRRPACIQMRPGSAFLTDLNQDFQELQGIEITSIWTPADLTIVPATSACLPRIQSRRVTSPMHGLLLFDPWVLAQVADALTAPFADEIDARGDEPPQ
jgi:triacylglycerol lipase